MFPIPSIPASCCESILGTHFVLRVGRLIFRLVSSMFGLEWTKSFLGDPEQEVLDNTPLYPALSGPALGAVAGYAALAYATIRFLTMAPFYPPSSSS